VSGVIEALLTPSGQIHLGSLMRFARSCDVADFCRFVRRPVLAGTGVQPGNKALNATLDAHKVRPQDGEMRLVKP
jgi:hypothetical protein